MSRLTCRVIVHIHAFPAVLGTGKNLMHDAHVLEIFLRLAPPLHPLAMHRSMRVRMQVLFVLKVHDGCDFVGRGALRGVDPAGCTEEAMLACICAQFFDHEFEAVADFFETGAKHAEWVVRYNGDQEGTDGFIAGLFLDAFGVGVHGGSAVE
jgi:hypothetical protein